MPSASNHEIVLEARNAVKQFPGVLALDRVNFQVRSGEVHGLIGENGAGKSTLMHVLAGAQQPDEGQILLDGREVVFASTRDALDQRIAIVYQELNLVPHLTVAENIFLGRELLAGGRLIDAAEQNRRCEQLLKQLDPTIDPKSEISQLRVGQQQIVEIAKALNTKARVIFMDEPTSAISDQEAEVLFDLIESLKQEGIAIVYVSHKLDELMQICDRITILRDGRLVETVDASETDEEAIVSAMVGRKLRDLYVRTVSNCGNELLRVEQLSLSTAGSPRLSVDQVSFHAMAGEVLGIFGLMGAGRTELLESIFGLHPRQTEGAIWIDGARCTIQCPSDAMRRGIGFVPEDRKQQGLVLQMDVQENITLANLEEMERGMMLSSRLERAHAQEHVDRLAIKTPSLQQTVQNLSGGNQQKVVLAKVLSTKPRILLLDEPTRGIDVSAKREIYVLIDELKRRGLAIVFVSSELPEILGVADRILVMCEGQKSAEFLSGEANEEALMRAAVPGVQQYA
ncbi:sugar ABC transporter ATP-binding protein [Pirellulales bacterium]|nr:sugar ABC transporter ATP-binding protein [Pirellulales bacterium]